MSDYLLDKAVKMAEPFPDQSVNANTYEELPAIDDPATYEYVRRDFYAEDALQTLGQIGRDAKLGAAVREAVGKVDAAKLHILQDACDLLWANETENGLATLQAVVFALKAEQADAPEEE